MPGEKIDTGGSQLVTHPLDQLYEVFHENSKLTPYNEHRIARQVHTILSNPSLLAMLSKGHHRLSHLPRVSLPREAPPTGCSLDEAIRRRRSVRQYTAESVTLTEVAQLLSLGCGITGSWQYTEGIQQVRAAPSAGALYPIETYLVVRRVTELERGVCHYNVPDHALELMPDRPDLEQRLQEVSHYAEVLTTAAAVFVLTAVFDRTTFKYGDRGYRFVLLDAGHLAQNLLLTAVALGLGATPIGGFRDDLVSSVVAADGVNEAAVYVICVGRPAAEIKAFRGE